MTHNRKNTFDLEARAGNRVKKSPDQSSGEKAVIQALICGEHR
jgi:hypothetical protein